MTMSALVMRYALRWAGERDLEATQERRVGRMKMGR